MKIIGFFLVVTSFAELAQGFNAQELVWFVVGIAILAGRECLDFFSHTERFIHREK